MADTEDREIKHKATSGLGWKRLEDGNYVWQPNKRDEARIVSETTFKALQKLRRFETLFAILTLWPVFPMTIFFLKGHLSGWIVLGAVLCLAVPNYLVNRSVVRRQRHLLLDGAPTSRAVQFPTINTALALSTSHLRRLMWLAAATCFACVYVLMAFVPGSPLAKPPETISPYTTGVVLIAAAAILHLTRKEVSKRMRPEQ